MVCHAHGKSIRPTDGLKLPYWLIKKQTNMEAMESLKFDELIFVVLEHEDGVKAAFEGNHGIAVFGGTTSELTDNILAEVDNHFKGAFTGGIRIREFKDTIIKIPFISGKL